MDIVASTNKWASFLEHLWKVAKYFGFDGWLSATCLAALSIAFAATLRVLNAMPWYITVFAGLLFAILVLQLFSKFRIAWSLRGIKSFDLAAFAEDCCAYYRDFSEFMVNRQDARPKRGRPDDLSDPFKQWQENVEFSQRSDALIMQKFGARAFAISHQLKNLGIPAPNLFHFSSSDAGGVGVYIGMVGELLKKACLKTLENLILE